MGPSLIHDSHVISHSWKCSTNVIWQQQCTAIIWTQQFKSLTTNDIKYLLPLEDVFTFCFCCILSLKYRGRCWRCTYVTIKSSTSLNFCRSRDRILIFNFYLFTFLNIFYNRFSMVYFILFKYYFLFIIYSFFNHYLFIF